MRPRLRALVRDTALTDPAPGRSDAPAGWEIDPNPLIFDAATWAPIEAALKQRARYVNALLLDLYSRQAALKDRLVPPEVVLADPYFRRPCRGLEPNREAPATILRFDLALDRDNRWCFIDTRVNTPIGLGHMVQTRRFLTQELGPRYGDLQPDYRRVIDLPLRLLSTLQASSGCTESTPGIVVLTAGPADPFYSEHSFLARKMGVPLAEGDDLLVVDERVYFKTISGLQRVDIIYRRLNDAHIDPVVFSTDREHAGIPGLMHCIRRGTVFVANAIGCGVAENRALSPYLTTLMRFFLGERPLLPDLPTYTCGDTDQLDTVLDEVDNYVLRPAHDPRLGDPRLHAKPPALVRGRLLPREVREQPWSWVARTRAGGDAPDASRHLTCFVMARDGGFEVLPGGIVRKSPPPPDTVGLVADCIVLQDAAAPVPEAQRELEPPTGVSGLAQLGSRAAENLCWLGRYLERAEAGARMLLIFDEVAFEELTTRDRARWAPIWQGFLEATGHSEHLPAAPGQLPTALSPEITWAMITDPTRPSSIYNDIASAAANARRLRDHLSPEASALLPQLVADLDRDREPGSAPPADFGGSIQNTLSRVIVDLNAFLGVAERTMLHDAGWYFLRLGVHLERAIMTCSALRHALAQAQVAQSGAREADVPELAALLRMLGSQDAYRRLYRTRSRPRLVADLMLRQGAAPRSLVHNLGNILRRLQAIRVDVGVIASGSEAVENAVGDLLGRMRGLDLDRFFPKDGSTPAASLGDFLGDVLDGLYDLHPLLSDHYFSHQARVQTVPDIEQEELPLR